MLLTEQSVTLYVRCTVTGPPLHVVLVTSSLTHATTGDGSQLSASSVTTAGFGDGIELKHSTLMSDGLLAVGFVTSCTLIVCITVIELPEQSVTLYVRCTVTGPPLHVVL